jgi:probable F420-dependent oxidoreductase
MFVTDRSMNPVELSRELEARGYDAFFLPEHTHMPVHRQGEREMPEWYRRTYDPVVALSAAAAVTERLVLGTSICLVPQRDPIILAKQLACIDQLSGGGRLVLGAGFGWHEREMRHHGIDPADRWTLMRENIGAMRALWRDHEASYEGTLVRFEPSWSWPKPADPAGPPVFLGGAGGGRMVRHLVDYADGWFPNRTGPEVDATLATLRAEAERCGRDPASIRFMISGAPEPEFLATQEARGCERVLLPLPSAPRDEVLPVLDRFAAVAREHNGS